MAFLDNSGDIILDAVLTDTGRFRLARGDGSFRIAKFAFGDDEINYTLYNKNDSRGSAFYDLEIMQTPILEAFTNNTSLMKSRLVSIDRTNLLYLPILKLNEVTANTARNDSTTQAKNSFVVAVDDDTLNEVGTDIKGLMFGAAPGDGGQKTIMVDQGLDTNEISPRSDIHVDLLETHYIIEIDNRLGRIVDGQGAATQPSFIDDDNIASYYFSLQSDRNLIRRINNNQAIGEGSNTETIKGPRGSRIRFRIASSIDLQTSDFLFTKLGNTGQSFAKATSGTATVSTIDTHVRITGLTTGYRIDIPVRFIKK